MEEKKELKITREFDAPRDLVWEVHTTPEHMARWWGPKGFKTLVTKMDLRPGGIFHYGMEAPDGTKMWGRFVYREIVPKEKMVFVVSFSDENGGVTANPYSKTWPLETLNTVTLEERNGKTILTITGHPINSTPEQDQEFYAAFAGMNQGFKGTYDQLEAYLAEVSA